jgi:HSP20 family protein
MKALTPWRRRLGGPLFALEHEMEDLVHKFLCEPVEGNGGLWPAWSPRVDVEETDNELLVKADLPGVDPKDADISLVGGVLILRGKRTVEHQKKEKNFHRVERLAGEFYREIPLPTGADPDRVTAVSSKGVLTITIPKKAEVRPRKIPVHAAK